MEATTGSSQFRGIIPINSIRIDASIYRIQPKFVKVIHFKFYHSVAVLALEEKCF
jgi:hypothetical protein